MSWFTRGPSLPSAARSLQTPNPHRVWHPSHGIVFGSNSTANTPRSISTSSVADSEPHNIPYSNAGDSHLRTVSGDGAVEGSNVPVVNGTAGASSTPLGLADEILLEDPEQNEIPQSTMSFRISEEVFRGAKNAAPGSPESFWSHTLYRGPGVDGAQPKVKVHYCKTKSTTERVLQEYFLNQKVLGFDIEWKPDTNRYSRNSTGIKNNVSLIQLASEDRIALFHIALYPGKNVEDLVSPNLKKIMEDPSISKVGIAIKGDCTRLRKFMDIDSRGIFELSHLYKLVKFSSSKDYKLINKQLVSLATQVQDHLHLPMFKGGDVRQSDWSQPLAMNQIAYAASDSYAGFHLYDTLELKRKALDPTPPRPYHMEENQPIRLAEGIEIPTDEGLELEEPDPATAKRGYPKLPPSYLASAVETIELDPDFDIQSGLPLSSTANSPSATRSRSTPKPAPPPKHPLVIAAESLSASYRISHPKNRATAAALRCYFLWHHNPDLTLQDIAATLRQVPLQTTTVVNYILESVKSEKLPFEKERLRGVLGMLPKEVVWVRYRTLARACGEVQKTNGEHK